MGTVTKTIGSGAGRDYSTPQAWADALPSNLVSDGNSQVGDFYADSEFNFTGSFGVLLTLSGHTTDATHTITFQAAPGQSFADNCGVQSNAFCYNPANGAALKVSGNYSQLLGGTDSNVFISRLMLANYGAGNNNNIFTNTLASGTLHLSQLICENSSPAAQGSNLTNGDAANCLFIQRSNHYAVYSEYKSFSFVNCGFVSPSDVANTKTALHGGGHPTPSFVNCFFFGFSGGIADGNGTPSGSYNATDFSSVGFGTNNLTALSFGAQFQNVLNATRDFRLKSGAGLIDAGQSVGTGGVPSADAAGTSRPQGTAPDIGPWEFVQAAGRTLSGSITEAADGAAATADTAIRASANFIETRDGAAAVSALRLSGFGAAVEAPEAAASAARVRVAGGVDAVEAPDGFTAVEEAGRHGMLSAADSADSIAALAKAAVAASAALQADGDASTGAARVAVAGDGAGVEGADRAAGQAVQIAPFVIDPRFLVLARPRRRAAAPAARVRAVRPRGRIRTIIPAKRP